MIAIDTNIIVYSHRAESPRHEQALATLRSLVEGSSPWAIPWPCVHEFLSVVSNPKVFKKPTPARDALAHLRSMEISTQLHWISEGPGYFDTLKELVISPAIHGGRIHDVRIAALCIHHGVRELWTADRDFTHFPRLKIWNPLADARR
ncbi:MAG: PIN domain-containing protein [Planctomycetes bacterium]|nr:PIN domain-containing protein [Planctomycetota bacterium]